MRLERPSRLSPFSDFRRCFSVRPWRKQAPPSLDPIADSSSAELCRSVNSTPLLPGRISSRECPKAAFDFVLRYQRRAHSRRYISFGSVWIGLPAGSHNDPNHRGQFRLFIYNAIASAVRSRRSRPVISTFPLSVRRPPSTDSLRSTQLEWSGLTEETLETLYLLGEQDRNVAVAMQMSRRKLLTSFEAIRTHWAAFGRRCRRTEGLFISFSETTRVPKRSGTVSPPLRVPGMEALHGYLSFSLAIQASASASVANTFAAVVGRVPVTAISIANVPSFSGTTR